MKFTDTVERKEMKGPIRRAGLHEIRGDRPSAPPRNSAPPAMGSPGIGPANRKNGTPLVKDLDPDVPSPLPANAADREYVKFQDRLRAGKVKLCRTCGGVMRKSSRMILSAAAGVTLLLLGTVLMCVYGLATNFYNVPWFAKFALPAAYYIGSIFIGVGVLFFFIREKVWECPACKEMDKR